VRQGCDLSTPIIQALERLDNGIKVNVWIILGMPMTYLQIIL